MKEKILSKIVGKDYDNDLEKVLSKKNFSEDVKNTLLSMLYKIENGYDDYNRVKQNTFYKQEYIEKIINIIDKNCDDIEFISKDEESKQTVNNKEKKIVCLPIDQKILYSIAKIQKKDVIVKYEDKDIEQAFSFILNTGNNINMVEPLRDFNGFSWNITVKEIESLSCNLIYQNIIYLTDNKFVDEWVNNYEQNVDYFKLFQNKIEERYGNKAKENIITKMIALSLKIKSDFDEKFEKKLKAKWEKTKLENEKMQNTTKYIVEIVDQKKEKEDKIKEIDKILSNKILLKEERARRNKELTKTKQIPNIKELEELLKKERKKLLKEIKDYNKEMTPTIFLSKRDDAQEKLKYLDVFEDFDLTKKLISLQKDIIICMRKDLRKATTKKELIKLIYDYRYYNYLPLDENRFICNVKALAKSMTKLTKELVCKATIMNAIVKISDNEEINTKIIEQLFLSKIIELENVNIEITKVEDVLFLTVFDEDTKEIRIQLDNINREDIILKLNKKIKFIL